jgi:hypothetical protein
MVSHALSGRLRDKSTIQSLTVDEAVLLDIEQSLTPSY